jgi:hypothetical protein
MTIRRSLLGLTFLLCSSAAPAFAADVSLEIHFDSPPPLVVISPGIQVVPDYGDEVYYVDSWYWVRRDGRWWRMRTHSDTWAVVVIGNVPAGLQKIPPGKYKRYKPANPGNNGNPKPSNSKPAAKAKGGPSKGHGNGKGK